MSKAKGSTGATIFIGRKPGSPHDSYLGHGIIAGSVVFWIIPHGTSLNDDGGASGIDSAITVYRNEMRQVILSPAF